MARPERNDVDYFPHTVKHSDKMFYIEHKYKNDGYAAWFKMLEVLGKKSHHYIDLNSKAQVMYLSSKCLVSEEMLLNIIDDLVELEEFNSYLWKNFKILFNQSFIDSIEDAYKKRNNKCITLEGLVDLLQIKVDLKQLKCILKGDGKPQRIVKDSKGKKNKEENSIILSEASIRLSEFFLKGIKTNNPKSKYFSHTQNQETEHIKKWALHIDRLIRIDKQSEEDIKNVIDFCLTDHFESTNVLSTEKLRKRWDNLFMKANKKPKESDWV